MRQEIERGPDVNNDLEAILDFLFGTHLGLGERPDAALERADQEGRAHRSGDGAFGKNSQTRCVAPQHDARSARRHQDRAIFYFTVDDETRVVRVLAVYFGGQDHQREMLKRLMGEKNMDRRRPRRHRAALDKLRLTKTGVTLSLSKRDAGRHAGEGASGPAYAIPRHASASARNPA